MTPATRQRTTPTTLTSDVCRSILAPLRHGGHIRCRREGRHNWWIVLLARRPNGLPARILGSGRTLLAAERQAAERVLTFGAQRVLCGW